MGMYHADSDNARSIVLNIYIRTWRTIFPITSHHKCEQRISSSKLLRDSLSPWESFVFVIHQTPAAALFCRELILVWTRVQFGETRNFFVYPNSCALKEFQRLDIRFYVSEILYDLVSDTSISYFLLYMRLSRNLTLNSIALCSFLVARSFVIVRNYFTGDEAFWFKTRGT